MDCLEAEILKQREEMNRLQIMNNDQQLSKEAAKVTYKILCDKLRAYVFPDTVYELESTPYCSHKSDDLLES